MKQAGLLVGCVLGLPFAPEDRGSTFLLNVGRFYQTTRLHDLEEHTVSIVRIEV
jgi:hypothetical protein